MSATRPHSLSALIVAGVWGLGFTVATRAHAAAFQAHHAGPAHLQRGVVYGRYQMKTADKWNHVR